jgi:hypothetical protein
MLVTSTAAGARPRRVTQNRPSLSIVICWCQGRLKAIQLARKRARDLASSKLGVRERAARPAVQLLQKTDGREISDCCRRGTNPKDVRLLQNTRGSRDARVLQKTRASTAQDTRAERRASAAEDAWFKKPPDLTFRTVPLVKQLPPQAPRRLNKVRSREARAGITSPDLGTIRSRSAPEDRSEGTRRGRAPAAHQARGSPRSPNGPHGNENQAPLRGIDPRLIPRA